MAGAAHCSLRAKRLLLDPKFEGYKLSLEPLACYQLGLDAGEEQGRSRRASLGQREGADPAAFPFTGGPRCRVPRAGDRPPLGRPGGS